MGAGISALVLVGFVLVRMNLGTAPTSVGYVLAVVGLPGNFVGMLAGGGRHADEWVMLAMGFVVNTLLYGGVAAGIRKIAVRN